METGGRRIEVVRGRLADEMGDRVRSFWALQGALAEEDVRERLEEVVCVALDESGQVVGVNSVRQQAIPVVRRPFWVYRSLLPGGSEELAAQMFNAAFDALGNGFEPGGSDPLGVCVLVRDRTEMEARPEAIWADTQLLFAGYTPDERQVRIRFFWGAKVGPGAADSPSIEQQRDVDYTLEERYRIELLQESTAVTPDDVLALWAREGVMPGDDALKRIHEVRLVAVADWGEVAGVSTVYLERNRRLAMDMWNYRTFVASAHRMSNLAAQLIIRNRDQLESAFASGEDTRGQGVLFHLQNEGMKRHLNNAYWPPSDFTYIGDSADGDHVRVHFFPGARVPVPTAAAGYH